MTVSIESTSRKYRGRKAATYEKIRKKQERWDLENAAVEQFVHAVHPRSVLDVPVGTGRFFELYERLDFIKKVTGVDCSEEMLALARKKKEFKNSNITLTVGDARGDYGRHDLGVCVRFLDLIDEKAMHEVVAALCGQCDAVVCTVRFGEKYVPKSNTAEHDEKKFRAHVKKLGFVVEQEYPIFKQGWCVLLLRRKR